MRVKVKTYSRRGRNGNTVVKSHYRSTEATPFSGVTDGTATIVQNNFIKPKKQGKADAEWMHGGKQDYKKNKTAILKYAKQYRKKNKAKLKKYRAKLDMSVYKNGKRK